MQYGLQNLTFENPGGVFDGVLWNSGRIEASSKAKRASVGLCLYLLHQLNPAEEAELTKTLSDVTKRVDYSLPPKPEAVPE